jgi:hypothetical protein
VVNQPVPAAQKIRRSVADLVAARFTVATAPKSSSVYPDAASRELSLMHDRQATIDFGTHLLTVSGWMIESAP